ncbi:hypothetical protein K490DRAFT_32107 [Saccharata proteae CBS 121410]|uniref:Integral membrane protein n=1 Tax=Saccharata proteae CBS 121410 TaxID=1314787 RepID=A0A9P4M3E4_9PEZI|nr:hypothetical protein K490DRAFT_32107 [Saccharata proteae CBS 121410]
MASRAVIPFLVGMMLLTGVCNTLLTKYQDNQCVRDCDTASPKYFEQPVVQTAQMFIGEMGCWLVVAAFALYTRYIGDKSPAGYEAVPGTVTDGAEETEANGLPNAAATDGTPEDSDVEIANPLKPEPHTFERIPLTGAKVLYLALPACCDIAGTTLMNVGLLFVAASIYQMTRGALVLFVGLFSVIFLKRTLGWYKWLALVIVVAGVAVVGLAGALEGKESLLPPGEDGEQQPMLGMMRSQGSSFIVESISPAAKTVIGIFLIAGAQIFTASQFVLEENIMEKYELEPLKVVGWEGIFGFLVTAVGMFILHFAVGRTDAGRYGYFDAREGLWEITHYRAIAISSLLIMVSIGGFNFFGLSVTRTVSATSRATIDTCRTLFIWVVSLGLGWESFKWLQVLGFALLVYGTFLFNDIVRPPLKKYLENRKQERERRRGGIDDLLPEGPIEHL